MAISLKGKALLSRLKPLLALQRFNCSLVENGPRSQSHSIEDYDSVFEPGDIDISKWKKLDSRFLGISRTMISSSSLTVLKILQRKGFEAYLVGGCVRDLLLKRAPKDFDVITTAALKQIRKQFYRCEIVGRRFPICQVHIMGSTIEVSSFQTLAQHAEEKEKFLVSQMPRGCNKLDLVRWRNSMHRDFTINSLFFDPFVNKIYDYTDGMKDLLDLKLRTLIPAQLSFKEDIARILRGLRIAARLGLSFSKETEIAICKLSSSISRLNKSRIMMELNYMLSFGAAEPSLSLLQRFNLLEILLPFHAAYLSQQAASSSQSSVMFMKLFSSLDQLVSCDRPSHSRLWLGLLAFHLALVNKPQHPLVVLTFASVLYHAKWKEGVNLARQHAEDPLPLSFVPEISEVSEFKSDDVLAERVNQFALLVQDSVHAFTETDSQLKMMARFPDSPCSGLVFLSKSMGNDVAQLFNIHAHDAESYNKGRKCFEINYDLLRRGDASETRFALGKIIMDTMSCEVGQGREIIKENTHALPDLGISHPVNKDDEQRIHKSPSKSKTEGMSAKKQKLITEKSNLSEQGTRKMKYAGMKRKLEELASEHEYLVEKKESQEVAKKHSKVVSDNHDRMSEQDHEAMKQEEVVASHSPRQGIITMLTALDNAKFQKQPKKVMKSKQVVVDKEKHKGRVEKNAELVDMVSCILPRSEVTDKKQKSIMENEECHLDHLTLVTNEKHKRQIIEEKGRRLRLSTLFK